MLQVEFWHGACFIRGMPILDLKRDTGFLFRGVSAEPDQQTLVSDLRHLFNDFEVPEKFNSITEFENAVTSHQGGCQGSRDWRPSTILTAQVQRFFKDVEDVVQMGNRVFYDINGSVQKTALYDGADVLVNYKNGPTELFRMIYESYDWMPIRVESYMTVGEGEIWNAMGFDHETVKNLFSMGIGKKDIIKEAKWLLEHFNVEQVVLAISHRYVDQVQGLREEDQLAILKLELDPNFIAMRRRDLAIYTQDPSLSDEWYEGEMNRRAGMEGKEVEDLSRELRRKFELHFIYAQELAAELEHVSEQMILAKIMAESCGDRLKSSPVGYKGLMQLGENEFKTYVDPTLPDEARADIFHYRANMSAGSRYWEWCFEHFNSEPPYFAVASGNYNYGPGNMRKYLDGGSLPDETRLHIAKLLVFGRLFSELGIEQ